MIYILIALALFGFLTMTMSRQANQSDGQDLNDEQIALYTDELIGYVASVQIAIDMMLDTGSKISDLDFITPDEAAFNTPPHIRKVFHPQGGGINYQEKYNDAIMATAGSGWKVNTVTNVEWSESTANDVILSAYFLPESICSYINEKLTGGPSIPLLTLASLELLFDPDDAGIEDFDIVDCPACEGKPNLCVGNSGGTNYGFYNIIIAQ